MPFVDEFLRLHPNISLDISFNDEVQDLIEARDIDLLLVGARRGRRAVFRNPLRAGPG
jgi:DNA-binding transcriptional LysR family regulator